MSRLAPSSVPLHLGTLATRPGALVFAVALLAVLPGASHAFDRGMVVSCPGWGPIWGSPAMGETLVELGELGVEAVAIHPYGWVKRDGRVEFRPAQELDFLARAVALAEEAGIELFWKPHLGYWGQFSWRGAIDFGDDRAAWDRFFADYEAFILDQARFAARYELPRLAVGVELDATLEFEAAWRRILAGVRAVYSGTLVYAANWDRIEDVPFWDALDEIGVHAYFPLSDSPAPGRPELEAGWLGPLQRLRTLSERFGKPVLVAEIGYNLHPKAAREPWEYATLDTESARSLRHALIDVALEVLEAEEFVSGMYWWKWMPGSSSRRRNFSMREAGAREVLARRWRAPAGGDSGDASLGTAGPGPH